MTNATSFKSLLFACAALGLLLSASVVSAEGRGGACRQEIQSVCGEFEKEQRSERRACIEANMSSFSEACQEKIAERKARKGKRGKRNRQ